MEYVESMDITTITTIALYSLFGVFVVLHLLLGLAKGLARTFFRFMMTLVSALVAFLAVRMLGPSLSEISGDAILTYANGLEDFGVLIQNSEAVSALISVLGGAILLPIVFVGVFLVSELLMSILYLIFRHCIKSKSFRPLGMVLGAVKGALVAVILLFPLLAYTSFADQLFAEVPSFETSITENLGEENAEILQEEILPTVRENVVYITLEENVVSFGMKQLTAVKYRGEKVDIYSALEDIGNLVEAAMPLTEEELDYEHLTEKQLDAIDGIVSAIGESRLFSDVIGDVVAAYSEKWEKGDDFAGASFPLQENAGAMNDLYRAILKIFSTSTGETIVNDLHTFCKVAKILYQNDVIASATDAEKLMDAISSEGTVSELVEVLCENDHLKPVVPEVMNLGIWALTQSLGIPADLDEAYENLMVNITDLLQNGDPENLKSELGEVLADYGAEIPAELSDCLADVLYEEVTAGTISSVEDVKQFFSDFNALYEGELQNQANAGKSGLVLLSSKESDSQSSFESLSRLLESLNSLLEEGGAIVASFSKAETAPIHVITGADLKANSDEFSELSGDALKEEIEAISEIISLTSSVVKSMKNESGNALDLIEHLDFASLGAALEKMNGTTLLGAKTGDLLDAVLSSDAVRKTGVIGRETVEGMRESLEKGNGELGNALTSMQQTVSLVTSLSSSESDEMKDAAIEEKVTWLIENMSPSSAKILSSVIRPALLEEKGMPAHYSDRVSNVVSILLSKLADQDAMTTEEYTKEANAVKYLYHVAMDAKDSTEKTLFGGRLPEANVLVQSVFESKVISATLEEAVFGSENGKDHDPMGIGSVINSKDKATLETEINLYVEAHPEVNKNTVEAVRCLFGLSEAPAENTAPSGN